jgi:hypothetical protein
LDQARAARPKRLPLLHPILGEGTVVQQLMTAELLYSGVDRRVIEPRTP